VHDPRIIPGIRLLKEFVYDSDEPLMILIDVRMANAKVFGQGYHSHLQSRRLHHFIVILQTQVCRRQTLGAAFDHDRHRDETLSPVKALLGPKRANKEIARALNRRSIS
jgi:hypothetical protein